MSIENLKKLLESGREIEAEKKSAYYEDVELKDLPADIPQYAFQCVCYGHEAATNRLLPLLQKAVENIEKLVHELESSNRYDESCSVNNWIESEPEKQRYDSHKEAAKKAREFLLSLSETTESVSELTKMTEIKKEGL